MLPAKNIASLKTQDFRATNILDRNNHMFFFVLLIFQLSSCKSIPPQPIREKIDFTRDWAFHLGNVENAQTIDFNDSAWRHLDVPHDWSIEGEFSKDNPAGVGGGALPGGIGWYRKNFTVEESDSGNVFYVDFDGVYQNSEVWINGHFLGRRPNGYISFRYDLTPHINYGDKQNIIAVKVDNSKQPNSRWYSGSGIYRNVWLVKVSSIHVDHWGTFVTTPTVNNDSAQVKIEIKIRNNEQGDGEFDIRTVIYDSNKEEIAWTSHENAILKDSVNNIQQEIIVASPHLWSVEDPYLYKVVTLIEQDGELLDRYETPLGIRYFNFDAEKGFSLNGKSLKIKGVCNHHDLGALGAAINTRALERQLEIMKEMGVNGIRTAHNPPAPELLDLCDKMGFIVMNEAFDMWKKGKNKHDYSTEWDEWHKKDLEDLILRDRNHPSIFMWSIGNEILEQFDSTGTQIAAALASVVRSLDTTRAITSAMNDPEPHNSIIKSEALDLIGFNYHHQNFEEFRKKFPGEKFIATETTSALATRGHYDMPSDSVRRWPISWGKEFTQGNADNTVSAYDNVSTPWGSTHDETWKIIKKNDFMSGMYIWTGFDYLGEPTPYGWPSRSSYFGVVDLAGFPKDAFYMYKSEWTNDTVLHIFPHWNWREGDSVDVWAYYNHADEVELFLDGESVGKRKKDGEDLHVMWKLAYQPGILKAVSRFKNKEVASKVIQTAGKAARIIVEADRDVIMADGKDLSFITVTVVDKEGNVVPRADNLIKFSVEGQASIVGVDNGDPTNLESFQSTERKAFNGLALAILKATEEPETIEFTASADGLESGTITIKIN